MVMILMHCMNVCSSLPFIPHVIRNLLMYRQPFYHPIMFQGLVILEAVGHKQFPVLLVDHLFPLVEAELVGDTIPKELVFR